jgi:hypothetical protein
VKNSKSALYAEARFKLGCTPAGYSGSCAPCHALRQLYGAETLERAAIQ